MPPATLITFPVTSPAPTIAGFDASTEGQKTARSPEDLVRNLVEDSEIRSRVGREYTTYFTNNPNLVRHWLSILAEHGPGDTEKRLRRVVSEFIYQKTEDEKTARAYHADCAKLFNVFIDDLTFHLLKEIRTTATRLTKQ